MDAIPPPPPPTMSNPPVPNPMASGPTAPVHIASAGSQPAAADVDARSPTPQQRALQQQIQAQLQSQLQAQLQAAAARGKQVNITPEMIQVRFTLFNFLQL